MKIGYLILAHNDPKHLERMVQSLNMGKDHTHFFIHIDKKSDIGEFNMLNEFENVSFITNRVNIERVGMSMVETYLKILDFAEKSGICSERYVFLAGSNYPIVNNKEIFKYLDNDIQFMKAFRITNSIQERKIREYYFHDIFLINRTVSLFIRRVLRKLNYFRRKNPYVSVEGEKWEVYYGSQWFGITCDCAKYILAFTDKHPEFYKYFKHAHVPSELYFHTIIYNSTFCQNCISNDENTTVLVELSPINFHIYSKKQGEGARFLNENDYIKITSSGRLFFGKVKTGLSDILLEQIDEHRKINNDNSI